MNEGTVAESLNGVVEARARLVLRMVECQVEVPSSQIPCWPFSSASTFSCTPYCESQPQRPRTDGSESTAGTVNMQCRLGRGLATDPKGWVASYPTRESLRRRGSSSRWTPFGLQHRPRGRDRQPPKQNPGRSGEQNDTLVDQVNNRIRDRKIFVAPAGSRTAPTDIDNREDWSWIAAKAQR